jgi:Flp pilus assembly protein TadD
LAHLKRAVELAPRNPEPLYQLAIAYRRLGMKAEADAATAAVRNLHEARRGAGAQTVAPPPNRPD